MKGFTLIEIIIYMAISTILCASIVSFSMLLLDSQSETTQSVQTEIAGTTLLRLLETDIRNNIQISGILDSTAGSLTDFTQIASHSGLLTTVSFSLDRREFTVSFLK